MERWSNGKRTQRRTRKLRFESMEDRRLLAYEAMHIESSHYDGDEFLVQFQTSHSQANPQVGSQYAGSVIQKQLTADGWYSVLVLPGYQLASAMNAFANRADVVAVTPDFSVSVETTANDSSYASQWALHNPGGAGGVVGADIDAEVAWQYGTNSSIIVGVIDTGIDINHPDLASNIWRNAGEVAGNGIDDDRNGYIDDLHGWDFANNDANPHDDNGHGTHVAGTIGATGNNGIGISGVAWRVLLMPLKFLDAQGSGNLSDAIEAIDYARAMGAKIINASWGGGGFSTALQQAITRFQNAGGIFVAAAGNDASNNATVPSYPANYSGVISVGASTRADVLASFSNYGTNVDIVAPGASILSTLPNNRYGSLSGTSMASPHVAGALALLWGQNPSLSAAALTQALLSHTDNVLRGTASQYGRLNVGKAAAALRGVTPDNPNPNPNPAPTPVRRVYTTGGVASLPDATSRSVRVTNIPIDVTDNIAIQDLNVRLNITHTWLSDLTIRLIAPDGTAVLLIQRRGGSGDNLQVTLDDQANTPAASIVARSTITGTYRSEQPLANLQGRSAQGRWTLQVIDHSRGDSGFLQSAALDILPRATTPTVNASPSPSRILSNELQRLFASIDFEQWLDRLTRGRGAR